MSPHSDPKNDPPTEERVCAFCGSSFQDLAVRGKVQIVNFEAENKCGPLCIKCDPAANDRNYRVVFKGNPS